MDTPNPHQAPEASEPTKAVDSPKPVDSPMAVDSPKPVDSPMAADSPKPDASALPSRRKGPLSFLSGALTAGLLSWLCLGLSRRMVTYYALHPPNYSSAIAQSIATALKTLIVGMAFLSTFSFGFIALGLMLVFGRSLLSGSPQDPGTHGESP